MLRRVVEFNQSFSGTFFDYYTKEQKEVYDNDIKDIDEILKKWSKNQL